MITTNKENIDQAIAILKKEIAERNQLLKELNAKNDKRFKDYIGKYYLFNYGFYRKGYFSIDNYSSNINGCYIFKLVEIRKTKNYYIATFDKNICNLLKEENLGNLLSKLDMAAINLNEKEIEEINLNFGELNRETSTLFNEFRKKRRINILDNEVIQKYFDVNDKEKNQFNLKDQYYEKK